MNIRHASAVALACGLLILCWTAVAAAQTAANGLVVTKADLRPGEVGTLAGVTLEIRNNSATEVNNPQVLCRFLDAKGAPVSSKTTVVNASFPPQATRSVKHIDFGAIDQKVASVRCEATAG